MAHLQKCNHGVGRVTENNGTEVGMLGIPSYIFCLSIETWLKEDIRLFLLQISHLPLCSLQSQFYAFSINSLNPPSTVDVWVNEQLDCVPNTQSNLAVGYYYTELLVYCLHTYPVQLVLIFMLVCCFNLSTKAELNGSANQWNGSQNN